MNINLDFEKIVSDMVDAAKGILIAQWAEVKDYAEEEMGKIAKRVQLIAKKFMAGEISEEEAKLLLRMQKNATASTLAILEGISLLMAEKAVNAALEVLKNAIKGLLPFEFD